MEKKKVVKGKKKLSREIFQRNGGKNLRWLKKNLK